MVNGTKLKFDANLASQLYAFYSPFCVISVIYFCTEMTHDLTY